jgi:hypothetical protein
VHRIFVLALTLAFSFAVAGCSNYSEPNDPELKDNRLKNLNDKAKKEKSKGPLAEP